MVGEENSSATIIESYGESRRRRLSDKCNRGCEVRFRRAALNITKCNARVRTRFIVATTSADLGPSANYDATTINFGAALSRHNIDVRMDHEGAECSVDGLYIMDGNQHTDTHSVIDHRQLVCRSQQLYKGILDGKSRAGL